MGIGKYVATTGEILGVTGLVGGLHYVMQLVDNFNAAASVQGASQSAMVGYTAAVGAVLFSAYKALSQKPSP